MIKVGDGVCQLELLLNDASIHVYLHLCAMTLSNQSQPETKLLRNLQFRVLGFILLNQ